MLFRLKTVLTMERSVEFATEEEAAAFARAEEAEDNRHHHHGERTTVELRRLVPAGPCARCKATGRCERWGDSDHDDDYQCPVCGGAGQVRPGTFEPVPLSR